MAVHAGIVRDPIVPGEVLAGVGGDEDGAWLLFLGVVRDHADGRPVRGLRYEAYEAMAAEELGRIARETAAATGVERLRVVHRVGELAVGEVSVAIAVSSPHREEAYAASRRVIEEIKARLPVWKKEFYTDGREGWVEGVDPPEGHPASAGGTPVGGGAAGGAPGESAR